MPASVVSSATSTTAGSASASDAAKRRRVLQKTPSDTVNNCGAYDQLATTVRRHNHDKNMYKVKVAMESDPELASNLAYMVETGRFARKAAEDDAGTIPGCCNKWALLKQGRKEALLRAVIGPQLGSNANLKELRKKDKRFLDYMLGFALHVDVNGALYSKNMSDLVNLCKLRFAAVTSPVKEWPSPTTACPWQSHGVFSFVMEGAKATHIKHNFTHEKAALAEIGHDVTGWNIAFNWDVRRAKLAKGKLSQVVYKLFNTEQQAQSGFFPLKLERVPSSRSREATVVRSDIGDRTAGSEDDEQATPPNLDDENENRPLGDGSAF
jgi:hypothetical protein